MKTLAKFHRFIVPQQLGWPAQRISFGSKAVAGPVEKAFGFKPPRSRAEVYAFPAED
jgi:hypothetical protein